MKKLFVAAILIVVIGGLAVRSGSQETTINAPIGRDRFNTIIPGKNFSDTTFGKEIFLAVGPVSGVGEYKTNGVATMNGFEDGSLFVGVQTNIEIAPDGSFYEAWLADENGTPQLSIGHLFNSFGDVRHAVNKKFDQEDLSATRIVITKEQDDGNPAASTDIVAESTLTERKR